MKECDHGVYSIWPLGVTKDKLFNLVLLT
jgi:hypothetical protein